MPMVITDARLPDNPIVLANKAFLELTGYSADEVIGRNCRFLQGEDTSAEAVAEIRRAIEGEHDLEIEILNYRKDGSAFWNQLGLSPVHNDAGKLLYFFASQIDVTELRKIQILEESEHRLLKEVDHRARNALAVVNSIVRLSRADDAARYADAIQKRVAVLAQAHTLLAERGWVELPLHEVIADQLRRPGAHSHQLRRGPRPNLCIVRSAGRPRDPRTAGQCHETWSVIRSSRNTKCQLGAHRRIRWLRTSLGRKRRAIPPRRSA